MDDSPASLDDLIADYLDQIDTGSPVDPADLAAAHPRYAEPFLAFVSQLDHWTAAADSSRSDQDESLVGRSSDSFEHLPQQFGSYWLLSVLGCGGMSTVYHAVIADKYALQTRPLADRVGATVAVKIFHSAFSTDPRLMQRAEREADAIESLQHDHIVSLHEFGQHEGRPYLAMQLVSGTTLGQWIANRPQRTTEDEQSVMWIADIADALDVAHRAGIVHRDVKPSNLLLDDNAKIWLTDFGLASLGEEQTRITATGQVVGTPNYMSPEQAIGSLVADPRGDVYSLGATLYELVCGVRAFRGDRTQVWYQVVQGRFTAPRKIWPTVPKKLEAIILKAMAHEPADRYDSASEMAEDLRALVQGRPVKAKHPNWIDRANRAIIRNPYRAAAAILAAATVAVAVILTQFIGSQALEKVNRKLAQTNAELRSTNERLDQRRKRMQHNAYVADMASAYRAYSTDDLDAVVALLQPHALSVDDPRGIEWWILHRLSLPPTVTTLAGHEGATRELAANVDAGELVSVGSDGCVYRWDVTSGEKKQTIEIGGSLDAVAVSPGGDLLVTGMNVPLGLNPVFLYRLDHEASSKTLSGHQYAVESAAFSPDGAYIATAGRYHNLHLYDRDGRLLGTVKSGSRNESLAFSHDGTSLFAVERPDPDQSGAGILREWKIPDLTAGQTWQPAGDPLLVFAVATQSRTIIGATSSELYRWDRESGVSQTIAKSIRGGIRCVAINSVGSLAAAACDNGMIYQWSLQQQRSDPDVESVFRVIDTLPGRVNSLCFVDSRTLAAGCESGSVDLYSIRDQPVTQTSLPLKIEYVTQRGPHADRLFARCCDDDQLYEIDLRTLTADPIMRLPSSENSRLACTSNADIIAAKVDAELWIIDPENRVIETKVMLPFESKRCRGLRFVAKDQLLVALFNDQLLVFDQGTWTVENRLGIEREDGRHICISDQQDKLLVVCNRDLWFMSLPNFETIAHCQTEFGVAMQASYSAAGDRVAVGYEDGTIEVIDTETYQTQQIFRGHRHGVHQLQFIENDRKLMSISGDDTLRFWDFQSGRDLGTLQVDKAVNDTFHYDTIRQRLVTFPYGVAVTPQKWEAGPVRSAPSARQRDKARYPTD